MCAIGPKLTVPDLEWDLARWEPPCRPALRIARAPGSQRESLAAPAIRASRVDFFQFAGGDLAVDQPSGRRSPVTVLGDSASIVGKNTRNLKVPSPG